MEMILILICYDFLCFAEDPKRKGLAQAPLAVTLRMKRPRTQVPGKTENGASLGLKTKDPRGHLRNDQRKNPALRILQVIRINCW